MKSGVYARRLRPIQIGPFAENVPDFYDVAGRIRGALAPRDMLEEVQAEQVIGAYMRAGRLQVLETAAADGAAAVRRQEFPPVPDNLNPAIHLQRLESLCDFLDTYDPITFHGHASFEQFARDINDFVKQGRASARGLWTEDHIPENEEEWRRVFDAFLSEFFTSREEARRHLSDVRDRFARIVVDGRAVGIGGDAEVLLDLMLGKTSVLQGRIAKDLLVQLTIYRELQQRSVQGSE